MTLRSMVLAAAILAAQAAGAQTPAEATPLPVPQPCETADEVEARVHFERSLRAWLDGKVTDARTEARAGLDASPTGRFAQPLRGLLARLETGRLTPGEQARFDGAAGSRAELIVAATLYGAAVGGLVAGAVKADDKGSVGLVMLGTAAGLVGSIAATANTTVRASVPPMFELGGGYGAFAVLLVSAIANDNNSGNVAGPVAAGVVAGSLLGVAAASQLRMTGGDAAAAWGGLLYGAALPVMIEVALGGGNNHDIRYELTALVGGTAGLVLAPLLNETLHWSRARWSLINLGGGVGLLMGLGTAVLVSANKETGFFALMSAGTVAGLGIAPQGRVRLGSLGEAVHPVVVKDRQGRPELGAGLTLLGGSF